MNIVCLIQEYNTGYYRVYGEAKGINFESIALKKLPEISTAFNISIEELNLLIKK